VRGLIELIEEGAGSHLDLLVKQYQGVEHFFGGCVAAGLVASETPVIGRIRPIRFVDEGSADKQRPAPRRSVQPPAEGRRAVATLPVSHHDRLERPLIAILSTVLPDGHPQTEPVWFGWDGASLSVNTTREKQKGRNLERDPRATLLIVDPADSGRWIEIRADVEIAEAGAMEHLDQLTRAYTSWPKYYDYVHPVDWAAKETRIVCRLLPVHVVLVAVFFSRRRALTAKF
jgi:PPOX class probable F420-dependent enzyme